MVCSEWMRSFIIQMVWVTFIEANLKQTIDCKQKSCARNAVQLLDSLVGKQANPSQCLLKPTHNEAWVDYFHAEVDGTCDHMVKQHVPNH